MDSSKNSKTDRSEIFEQIKINKKNLGLITIPISKAGITPLQHLVNILYPLAQNFFLVTGDAGCCIAPCISSFSIKNTGKRSSNFIFTFVKFFLSQIRTCYYIFKLRRRVHFWFLFLGGSISFFPAIGLKVLGYPVVILHSGSDYESFRKRSKLLSLIIKYLNCICFAISDLIVLYSRNMIEEFNLGKHKGKIAVAHEHFLDFDKFKIKTPLSSRNNLIGYIGRLSEEKGVIKFIEALPSVTAAESNLKIILGGDGHLRPKIKQYLDDNGLNDKVDLAGWISHDDLPDYLNKLKLLVLPSYTEGLPNIMLEAMACGTPVLATPVGAIPDYIKDGETGFIMENNSPECIAKSVIRALDHPHLEQISENGHILVTKEFTYEKAVERYKEILRKLEKTHARI